MSKITNFNQELLNVYYNSDVWDLTQYPNDKIAECFIKKLKKYRTLNFGTIHNSNKKQELKSFFKAILEETLPINVFSRTFIFYYAYISIANNFEEQSFMDIDLDTLRALIQEEIKKSHLGKDGIKTTTRFQEFLLDVTDTRTFFERDIWHLNKMTINEERCNASSLINTISFYRIVNKTNREYVKHWVRYLFGCTEYAVSTIMNSLGNITSFFNDIGDIDASNITSTDIRDYVDEYASIRSAGRINKILKNVDSFYRFFEVEEGSHTKSPILKTHYLNDSYVPADNLVSDNVILQLFKHLHLLPLKERCIFLISYACGTRISDICQMKIDCLYDDNDGGYYINYFCQKMQKQQMNLIPHALFLLLQQQQEVVRGNGIYLFPSYLHTSKPMQRTSYTFIMNEYMVKWGIKEDDGTQYRYKSHSFRHTLATDLLQNYSVDLQVIQLAVLNHQEIQMSLTYAQRSDDFNKTLHDKYISNYGEFKPLAFDNESDVNKKALGNGFCGFPDKLGTCPYSDICLSCEFFRTSKKFLDIHKKHLEEIRKNIVTYELNGWIPNLESAKETEKILIKIIDTLENL